MKWLLPLLLAGCGEPISNARLLEDGLFLAALPDARTWGPPANIRSVDDPESPSLRAAQAAAVSLDVVTAPAVAAGQAIRAVLPDTRTDVHRAWDSVAAPVTTDRGVRVFWARAVVVRDGSDMRWSIEGASDPDGPYSLLVDGAGAMDGSEGAAALDWAVALALLEDGPTGTLEVSWSTSEGGISERLFEMPQVQLDGWPDPQWRVYGEAGLGFLGDFAVTEDDAVLPGQAVVVHTPGGGRAHGTVLVADETPLGFSECWDATGATVWLAGDPGVRALGDVSACVVPEF